MSIENANGSAFNDMITGSGAANFLFGFRQRNIRQRLHRRRKRNRHARFRGNRDQRRGYQSRKRHAIDTLAGGLGDDVYLVSGDGSGTEDGILRHSRRPRAGRRQARSLGATQRCSGAYVKRAVLVGSLERYVIYVIFSAG